MKTSEKGISLIKNFEGLRLKPYICSAGKNTIYYGHVILPGEKFKGTEEEAEAVLKADLAKFEAGVMRLVKVPLEQYQFDALVSFAFNVGLDEDVDTKAEGLGDSTLLKKLNAGDYTGAGQEFLKWVYANGQPLAGLKRRRSLESQMFRGL